jgi:hypothetical protein
MTDREFWIVPATTITYLTIMGIILVAIVPLIPMAICFYRKSGQLTIPTIIFPVVAVVVLVVCGFFMYFGYSAKWTRFILTDEGLQIKGCLYGRTVPQDSIDKERIQMVNLLMEQNYSPVARTNGVGLPGYLSGWFRLKNSEKALLFVTKKTDVVYIPTSKGYSVLLSPSEAKEFLKVTQEMWKN